MNNLEKLGLKKIVNENDGVFLNLQQLYEYEFSSFTKLNVNKMGIYDAKLIKQTWSSRGVDIYLLFFNELPVGFAVVNLGSIIDEKSKNTRDIADFFIMKLHRRNGFGEWMATEIFKKYKGYWQVRQLENLEDSRRFWVKVIDGFTQGGFKEKTLSNDAWKGTVQEFELI